MSEQNIQNIIRVELKESFESEFYNGMLRGTGKGL